MKPSLKLSLLAIVGLCMSSCSEDNNLPVIHQDPAHIIISAYASSLKKGHTWLIDGVVIENSKFQYHFNWGWNGDSDGWSYGEVFQSKDDEDNESPKFDKDFSHIYLISKPK